MSRIMPFVMRLALLACLSASSRISDAHLADTMIGKAVEHMFETEDGTKNEWRGMVLARAPIMNTWFYITYEKDPVLYMYQLLDDYKDGDLRIMPDSSTFFQCFGLVKNNCRVACKGRFALVVLR